MTLIALSSEALVVIVFLQKMAQEAFVGASVRPMAAVLTNLNASH